MDAVADDEPARSPELADGRAARGVLVEDQQTQAAQPDQGVRAGLRHADAGAAGAEVVHDGVRAPGRCRADAGEDEFDRYTGRLRQDDEVVDDRDELGRGRFQHRRAGQRPAERPGEVGAGGDVGGLRGQFERSVRGVETEPDGAVRGQCLPAGLVRVDEQHAGGAVAARGPAQRLAVVEVPGTPVGRGERHRGQAFARRGQEVVLEAEQSVGGADLAVLAEGGLEVVADDRQIVGVAGAGRLLHGGRGVGDVGAALVHVVALPGRSAADLGEGQGGHVVRRDERAAVVGRLDAAAEFAGRVGVAVGVGALPGGGPAAEVGTHGVVVAQRGEEEMPSVVPGPSRVGVVPRRLGVARVHGEEFVGGELRLPPGRRGPQRRGDPGVLRHPLEGAEVFGLVVQLVLDLDGDDRPAPGVVEAVEFRADPRVVGPDQVEVGGVVGASPGAGVLDPVREAAVAGFAVCPGADPHHGVHAARAGQLDERADVAVAVEAELAAVLLVVVPEQVGRDDADAPGPHVEEPLPPRLAGAAGEVHLAHDREPGTAAAHQMGARGGDPVRLPLGLAHPEMAAERLRGRAQGHLVHHRSPCLGAGPGSARPAGRHHQWTQVKS